MQFYHLSDPRHRNTVLQNGYNACFRCRNCMTTEKWIGLLMQNPPSGTLTKTGEWPVEIGDTPASVITLAGPDRLDFLKGRRCETQGLGVGAFSYYRRVVERQKHRLFREIIRTLKGMGGHDALVVDLERAATETQFTKSVEAIRVAIPPALSINGQNPLTLLHDILSEGLHTLSDSECLEHAEVCRSVLAALSERLRSLREQNEQVNAAVAKLVNRKVQKAPGSAPGTGQGGRH